MALSPVVSLSLWNHQAKVCPKSYLGSDLFNRYRAACDATGAVFSRPLKAQLCELEQVPRLVANLSAAGFSADVSQDLAAALQSRAQAVRGDLKAAGQRTVEAGAVLQAQGLSLYPFQVEGVSWLVARRKALLLDSMGLGKTIQALIASPAGAPVIVVAPAAVKGNWRTECARWRPDLKPGILKGRGALKMWPLPGQLWIINFDILSDTLPDGPCPDGLTVIADEAHMLKNGKAKRTKAFRALVKAALAAGGRAWGLTGTPLLNRPPELWAVLSGFDLAKDAFGSWPRFVRLFNGRAGYWGGYEWGKPSPLVPELLRNVSLHRRRADVLPDLPTKTWRDVEAEIDRATSAACDKALAAIEAAGVDLAAAAQEAEGSRVGGAAFQELSRARAALATAKIPAMLQLIEEYEEEEQSLVVFSAHRAPIDALAARPGWSTITGDTSPEKRTEIVRQFQAGNLKGLALTIQAGGVGITLTHAHHALFVDLAWTPALNSQAEDRMCRIGQDRGVIITRLVADHELDKRVNQLLGEKQALISASVEASAVVAAPAAGGTLAADLERVAATPRPAPAAGQVSTVRHSAQTPVEHWAAKALLTLAGLDGDHAAEINGVGFAKFDVGFGHKLAQELQCRGELTDGQWSAVVKLCRKYWRQVGTPPGEVSR